jgi:hypothetical protein
MASAEGSVRLKLLKVAGRVRVRVRRVYVRLNGAYPLQELFRIGPELASVPSCVHLAQEQGAAIGGERAAGEIGDHLARTQILK